MPAQQRSPEIMPGASQKVMPAQPKKQEAIAAQPKKQEAIAAQPKKQEVM